jgi:lipoprotein-releasing system permease protein
MYQALLVRKYLFGKIMPLLAALSVMLCTSMLLVTWSVMGGFLTMLISSIRTMSGDVSISWPNVGFAHYDELVAELEKDPMIAAAAPVIETFGLIGLPNNAREMVRVRGIEPASYQRLTDFHDSIWWKPITKPLPKDRRRNDPRFDPQIPQDLAVYERNGKELSRLNPATAEKEPAVLMGIELSGLNYRADQGFYLPQLFEKRDASGNSVLVNGFMPRDGRVTLSVLPIDREGRIVEQASRDLPVANEFHTGVYETDRSTVLVPLPVLQQMLKLNAAKRVDRSRAVQQNAGPAEGGEAAPAPAGALVEDPARVTNVLIRGKENLSALGSANPLRERVEAIYEKFAKNHAGRVPAPGQIRIATWEDDNKTIISAVQKETGVVLFLFCFISLVSVFLVLAIFWSMIAEKTKDIGVMRALGASGWGVAGVWLFYGMVIGIVGALLGGLVSYMLVTNINSVHDWLGRALGITIWDPKTYYFTVIPSKINPTHAWIVMFGGAVSAVVGAIIPAGRAARMDPVRALRFE